MVNRRLASFGFAWDGIVHIVRTQPNWRIHVVLAALAVALGLALRLQPFELALLALTIGFVLALECINTAVEAAIDARAAPPSFAAKCETPGTPGSHPLGTAGRVFCWQHRYLS